MARRMTSAAALGVAGALLLTGCGGADGETEGAAPAGTSAAAVTATRPTTVPMTWISGRMKKAIAASSSLEGTIESEPADAMSGTVRFARIPAGMTSEAVMDSGRTHIELRSFPGAAYFGAAMLTGNAKDHRWVKVTPKGRDRLSTSLRPMVKNLTQQLESPGGFTTFPSAATVRVVGGRESDGVAVTDYAVSGTVSSEDLASMANQTESRDPMLGAHYDVAMTLEDATGRPSEVRMRFTMTSGQHLDMVARYGKWNEPIVIEKPPASTVVSPQALLD